MDDPLGINQRHIDELLALVRAAGDAIISVYNSVHELTVTQKFDDSPLTLADTYAHQIIANALPAILNLPMISEEGALPPFAERKQWQRYWLIDPLDGTKEFIQRSGEFTVNIALIDNGVPVLGVVHLPVQNITYIGLLPKLSAELNGAWKYSDNDLPIRIHVNHVDNCAAASLKVLASHRHGTEAVATLLHSMRQKWSGDIDVVNAGSSLKFCRIAEGKADFYPRLGPTSEWDTAAAQAVLTAAGGAVIKVPALPSEEFAALVYNQRDTILNPHFFAVGDVDFDWRTLWF